MKIGILTSGGDCPGLNATIRGAAKAIYEQVNDAQIIGIVDGYHGLIYGEYHKMHPEDFSGILTRGGTILGTSRQPYKKMRVIENNIDKIENMKSNYKKWVSTVSSFWEETVPIKPQSFCRMKGLTSSAFPKQLTMTSGAQTSHSGSIPQLILRPK